MSSKDSLFLTSSVDFKTLNNLNISKATWYKDLDIDYPSSQHSISIQPSDKKLWTKSRGGFPRAKIFGSCIKMSHNLTRARHSHINSTNFPNLILRKNLKRQKAAELHIRIISDHTSRFLIRKLSASHQALRFLIRKWSPSSVNYIDHANENQTIKLQKYSCT